MSKIIFDPQGPFPLIEIDEHSYQDAQEHSVLVDELLGFNTTQIEAALMKSQDYNVQADKNIPVQAWRGLPVQALQTPYTEIRYILEILKPTENETIVDLGSGYGRMAFVIGEHYPEVNFIGYELVAERVIEGQRILKNFNYPRVQLQTKDLTDPAFTPAPAEYYFLFDFGSAPAVDKTLEDLKKIAKTKQIEVIARGRYTRHKIYQSHPWLASINEPKDFSHFTVFSS